jgi:acrylyl-CoA reductase (NADPH)
VAGPGVGQHDLHRIARDLDLGLLESMVRPAALADVPALGDAILTGGVQGRVVVDVRA